ncbi:MAG TPA: AI-2E family transporter [Bacteroidota bacterium]|nr:AI-2E family transporter [Bacteroidota bacterium]
MDNFFSSRYWKVFIVTFSIAAPIFILSIFEQVFLLLVLSFALTMVLKSLVDFLESKGIPRVVGILGLYIVIGLLSFAGFMTIYPVIVKQITNISAFLSGDRLSRLLSQLSVSVSKTLPFIKSGELTAKIQTNLPVLASKAEETATSVLSMAGSFIIVPFITFFLLNDYHRIQKAFVENVPNKYFEMSVNVIHKLEQQLSKYIRGVFIELVSVAILYIGAYSVLGFRYAILLGIVCGLSNIIPMAGPVIAVVPVIAASLIQFGDFRMLLPIALTTFVVQQIDQMFIQPNVYGKILDMHPLTIVLTILIGSKLLGIVGMVLAIPIYTIIKVTARETNWGLKNYRITR